MIVARLIPMMMVMGTAAFGMILALILMGMLGFRYWSAHPISLTPELPPIQRALPVPVLPGDFRVPEEGLV